MMSQLDVTESHLASADGEQARMMEERVIVVDYYDRPLGSGSKKETHVMASIQAGLLHRAFSVFLFTPDGKLILQQRSGAKITFPYIWANTCCSHPLDVPSETIEDDARGVKNAARRKLEQELGISPASVPYESFTWLTRVHYVGQSIAPPKPVAGSRGSPGSDVAGCGPTTEAKDSHVSFALANGALGSLADAPCSIWGEHEIDWILMCKPRIMPQLRPNPNEVAAVRCFTQQELKEWMRTRHDRGEEVSPWFGLMEKSGLLYRWWDAVVGRNGMHLAHPAVIQRDLIHRQHDLEALVNPLKEPGMQVALVSSKSLTESMQNPVVHSRTVLAMPRAGLPTSTSASAPKQGAYGKVKVHSEPAFHQLCHLDEMWAALCYKLGIAKGSREGLPSALHSNATESLRFCDDMLVKVSRSFALVIQQLPPHLRTAITIFYLVLRGLDTVEDDMEAFSGNQPQKLHHLENFNMYLKDRNFRLQGIGQGDEAVLLENFMHVTSVFLELPEVDRVVIDDICQRMGKGMAEFAGRDLREGTIDDADYSLYCHYVAGLVGEGLSRLFVAHGDEDQIVADDIRLADDMGAFLQKTNIIRDYLEDLVEGRAFWPKTIWSLYSPGLCNLRNKVDVFRNVSAPDAGAAFEEDRARACLNHLVADAIKLAPSCLRYMSRLRTPALFRFCAIPQLMAIATLDKLANNSDVFTGVVKIRKGQALVLLNSANSMEDVYSVFLQHSLSILSKVPDDPSGPHWAARQMISEAVKEISAICLGELHRKRSLSHDSGSALASRFAIPLLSVFTAFILYLRGETGWLLFSLVVFGMLSSRARVPDFLSVLSASHAKTATKDPSPTHF